MIENASRRTSAPRGQGVVVTRRYGTNCEKRLVQIPGGGLYEMPTEMANKFERHLRSKTKAGRLVVALETQESL